MGIRIEAALSFRYTMPRVAASCFQGVTEEVQHHRTNIVEKSQRNHHQYVDVESRPSLPRRVVRQASQKYAILRYSVHNQDGDFQQQRETGGSPAGR